MVCDNFHWKKQYKAKVKKKKKLHKKLKNNKLHKNNSGIRNFVWFAIVECGKTNTQKIRPKMLLISILYAKK